MNRPYINTSLDHSNSDVICGAEGCNHKKYDPATPYLAPVHCELTNFAFLGFSATQYYVLKASITLSENASSSYL